MVLSMEKYRGKVAIVTGASAGCGVAIVEQLVEAGMIVSCTFIVSKLVNSLFIIRF